VGSLKQQYSGLIEVT